MRRAALVLATTLPVWTLGGCLATESDLLGTEKRLTEGHEQLTVTVSGVGKALAGGDVARLAAVEQVAAQAEAKAQEATARAVTLEKTALEHEKSISSTAGTVVRIVDDVATGGRIFKAIDTVAGKAEKTADAVMAEREERMRAVSATDARVAVNESAVRSLGDQILMKFKDLDEEDREALERLKEDREAFFKELERRASLTAEETKKLEESGLSPAAILALIAGGSTAATVVAKSGKSRAEPEIRAMQTQLNALASGRPAGGASG